MAMAGVVIVEASADSLAEPEWFDTLLRPVRFSVEKMGGRWHRQPTESKLNSLCPAYGEMRRRRAVGRRHCSQVRRL